MSQNKRSRVFNEPLKAAVTLFGDVEPTPSNSNSSTPPTLKLQQIQVNQQPRRYFDPEKLEQLKRSIEEHGILEPLIVRPLGGGEGAGYQLVAGERRYRAARELGLKEVPVVVHQLSDQQAIQVALIENLQREDLNPVEET
jgi:ParB family chromosome partitioning protein